MENRIKVNNKYKNKYLKGYPLILRESIIKFPMNIEEGDIISIYDENNNG